MVKYLLMVAVAFSSLIASDVSAYLYGTYKSADTVIERLNAKGFEVVGEYDAMDDENYHIVVFTNDMMKEVASRPNRGFAAVQKVLISKKQHELVFTNPEYFLHAFLQEEYSGKLGMKMLHKLMSAFGDLKPSKAGLDEEDIASYHFLIGMPYYQDMIEVAKGSDLLEKVEAMNEDRVVFTLKLKRSTLVGIAMDGEKGESYYLSKINGKRHAVFLPYNVLIEDGKAKILNPKYYIAISYPDFSMKEFVNISDTPDDIKEYMQTLFK